MAATQVVTCDVQGKEQIDALSKEMEKFKNIDIKKSGTKLILPEGMSYDAGIECLKRRREEDETVVAVNESIIGYPMDAAYALTNALAARYGWTNLIPTIGFFGQRFPPMMLGVPDSVASVVQVPWGRMEIPGIDGFLETKISWHDGRWNFTLAGQVKKKHREAVATIAQDARDYLSRHSLYRGKAVSIEFPTLEEGQSEPDFNLDDDCPKFIDLRHVKPNELIFSDTTKKLVQASLFTPVERTAACRKLKIPLKRGVLLEGPYGTGKTLTAWALAKKCEENGWTFIYLKNVLQLHGAIGFAKQYQPAVIFAEDVDQVMADDDDEDSGRNDEMNDILNTIDGIDSKNNEIIVCLTTNNVDRIHQAMLRPGRLDSVISVRAPDADAVLALIKLYGAGLLEPLGDFTIPARAMAGQIPAVIREVIERAKLFALSRFASDEDLILLPEDLVYANQGMLEHLKLLEIAEYDDRSAMEKTGDSIAEGLIEAAKVIAGNNFHKHKDDFNLKEIAGA